MTDLSFARTQVVKFNPVTSLDAPFDNNLTFNQIISKKEEKNPKNRRDTSIIYSIDPRKILDKLVAQQFEPLLKITLGCQLSKNGISLWDVVFNSRRRDSLAACIFVADNDYRPLRHSKVAAISSLLNPTMPLSRLQANVMEKGNKIGIAINDLRKRTTHVLLYTVAGICMADELLAENEKKAGNPQLINAINCELDQVYVIDASGSAEVSDVQEDLVDYEYRHDFVTWLNNSVNDPETAFPWKPHFLPETVQKFDRDKIEERVLSLIEDAEFVTYEQFEEECRGRYNDVRQKRINTRVRDGERNKAPKLDLPSIELVSFEDDTILASLDNSDGSVTTMRFTKPKEGSASICETFLLNKDLEGRLLSEVSNILVLNSEKFEGETVLRYVKAHF